MGFISILPPIYPGGRILIKPMQGRTKSQTKLFTLINSTPLVYPGTSQPIVVSTSELLAKATI